MSKGLKEFESALRFVSSRLADSEPLEAAAAVVPGGAWGMTRQMDLLKPKHIAAHIHMQMHIRVEIHTLTRIYVFVCMYVYIYICMYVCMYACMHMMHTCEHEYFSSVSFCQGHHLCSIYKKYSAVHNGNLMQLRFSGCCSAALVTITVAVDARYSSFNIHFPYHTSHSKRV